MFLYIWKFDNGCFKIRQVSGKWLLTVHLDDGTGDKLGSYLSPRAAADDIHHLDPEYGLPFEITMSTPLPMDLSEWEKLRFS